VTREQPKEVRLVCRTKHLKKDVLSRMKKAEALLCQKNDKKKRISDTFICLTGMEITWLTGDRRKYHDYLWSWINGILSDYPIKTEADYRLITDEDLEDIITHLFLLSQCVQLWAQDLPSTS
jgi:hypothetical protein